MAVPVVTHFPAPSSRWKAVKTNGKASDSLKTQRFTTTSQLAVQPSIKLTFFLIKVASGSGKIPLLSLGHLKAKSNVFV